LYIQQRLLKELTMSNHVIREITPLTENDCFTVFSRTKREFTFPLHSHDELELNLILGAPGTQRIVGDHIGEIGEEELVFVGPNLPHGWFTHKCKSERIREVTIQFNKDLLCDALLGKNQLISIKKLFENAKRGIAFPPEVVRVVANRIVNLEKRSGFDSILELFAILHQLSAASEATLLSDITFVRESMDYDSRRLQRVFDFLHKRFGEPISLHDVAGLANMSDFAFSRFIKQHTGFTFTEKLTEIRLGHVSRMLVDSSRSIGEIAILCGFNNMSNFNKIFRQHKGCTPKEFKKTFYAQGVFV
jgi:AraC-like DNA-binding protein